MNQWMDYGGSTSTYHLNLPFITETESLVRPWSYTILKMALDPIVYAATALAALCALERNRPQSSAECVAFAYCLYLPPAGRRVVPACQPAQSWKKSRSIPAVFLIPAFLLTSFVSLVAIPSGARSRKTGSLWWMLIKNIADYITHKIDDMNFQRNPGAGEFSLGMLGYSESRSSVETSKSPTGLHSV